MGFLIERTQTELDPIYQFIVWFTVSLLGIFFLITSISNEFTKALIISAIISFLGVKKK